MKLSKPDRFQRPNTKGLKQKEIITLNWDVSKKRYISTMNSNLIREKCTTTRYTDVNRK